MEDKLNTYSCLLHLVLLTKATFKNVILCEILFHFKIMVSILIFKKHVIYDWFIVELLASLLQSAVPRDPSEIIMI